MFSSSRHSLYFRLVAWMAMLAVMLPVWLPLVHHPVVTLAGGLEHICSKGLEKTKTDQNNGKSSSGKIQLCLICKSLHFLNSGFVPPAAIAAIALLVFGIVIGLIACLSIRHNTLFSISWPRAPPSFA